MGNRKLMALVGGVVVVLIAFSFYAPLTGAASNLYLQFVESCKLGGDSVLTVRGMETIDSDNVSLITVGQIPAPASGENWSDGLPGYADTQCGISAGAQPGAWSYQTWTDADGNKPPPRPATNGSSKPITFGDGTMATWERTQAGHDFMLVRVYTEDGTRVTMAFQFVGQDGGVGNITSNSIRLASGIVPGVWEAPVGITTRFGGINRLLISLLPLLLVISFLASAWGALYAYAGSADGGIKDAISWEVMTLVALMIAVFLAPVFLEFAQDASYVASSGAYQSTQRFSAIINLLFTLMPLAFTIGVIGIAVQRGYRTVQNIRGS